MNCISQGATIGHMECDRENRIPWKIGLKRRDAYGTF